MKLNNKNMLYEYYVFLEELNDIFKENIRKFKNINIIININNINKSNLNKALSIIKFSQAYKIPFYIINNYQMSIKYNADGVFLSSNNKQLKRPIQLKKEFKIIGLAHNQLEYYKKKEQSCKNIMVSPLFYNAKYSKNKILGINKFNLLTSNWNVKICALGGISSSNIKKIKMTKARSLAGISFFQKKSPLLSNSKGLL
jgi:thiamine-phosphate pyrophosphorylase